MTELELKHECKNVQGAGAERASESDSRHPADGDPYTTGPSLPRRLLDVSGRMYVGETLHNDHKLVDVAVEELVRLTALADSEGSRAVQYLRRALRAEAALRELVNLKDLKDRLHELHEMGHGTDYGDYHRRQPLAWAAARAVLKDDAELLASGSVLRAWSTEP